VLSRFHWNHLPEWRPASLGGELVDKTADWVSNNASVLKPSVREDALLSETKDFAKAMSRGIVALQTSL
jgi:hypothetical protein